MESNPTIDIFSTNLAAVLHGKNDMRMEHFQLPELKDDDVLLSMGSVGICGSDLKYWKYGVCGRFTLSAPMVIGHEGSGTVVKVGRRVTSLQPGDRVAVEPGVPCRCCELCRTGRYNLCPDIRFCATPPVHGNLAKYYVHPADFCFKLPAHVSLDEGALLEPLAVAVYGCQRGGVGLGSSLLVCGAGPVGLLVLMTAKALGAQRVTLTDIDEKRLKMAKDLGADHVIKVTTRDHRLLADQISETMGGKPEVSLECSGSDDSLTTAIFATRSGGSVVLVGRGSLEPSLPVIDAATREVDIKGVFRYANCYQKALSLVASGAVNVKPLITHQFQLEQSQDAFVTADDRLSGAVKVIIHCNE